MMFILRWPVILILLGLVAASVFPAAVGTIEAYNLPVDLSAIAGPTDSLRELAASTTMPERILWYAAAVFFLISAIRLIRRTQGFWMWLLGFACLGGRWALAQQHQEGGLVATVQSVDVQSFAPEGLAEGGASAQITVLIALLVLGLLIFIIDHADRAYWDKHGG
jgi:hypothetical protein